MAAPRPVPGAGRDLTTGAAGGPACQVYQGLKPQAVGFCEQSRSKFTCTRPPAGTTALLEPLTGPDTETVTVPEGTLVKV
jgi:hypothetical protein